MSLTIEMGLNENSICDSRCNLLYKWCKFNRRSLADPICKYGVFINQGDTILGLTARSLQEFTIVSHSIDIAYIISWNPKIRFSFISFQNKANIYYAELVGYQYSCIRSVTVFSYLSSDSYEGGCSTWVLLLDFRK